MLYPYRQQSKTPTTYQDSSDDSEDDFDYEEEEDKKEWKVKKIIDKHVDDHGKVKYKIVWEDSWQPVRNLNCPERIAEFEENFVFDQLVESSQNNQENLRLVTKRKSEQKTYGASSSSSKRSNSNWLTDPSSLGSSPGPSTSTDPYQGYDRHTCGENKFKICKKCIQFHFQVKKNCGYNRLQLPGRFIKIFNMELSEEVYQLLRRQETELRLLPKHEYYTDLKLETKLVKFKTEDIEITFSSNQW